jgi:hypothetical protein
MNDGNGTMEDNQALHLQPSKAVLETFVTAVTG